MASVSELKKKLDHMRFKYQLKKREFEKDPATNVLINPIIDEILQDIESIDLYCYGRNRY